MPEHPVINPNLEYARSLESKLDMSLIDDAIKNILVINLNALNSKDSEYL